MDNPVNPSSPILQEKSSLVIADQSTGLRRRKKILLILLILLIFFSFYSIFIATKKNVSVADIRNRAQDTSSVPAGGFGQIETTPPQVAVQIALTATPTPRPKTLAQRIVSFFQPSRPIPTQTQLTNVETQTPTQSTFQSISTPTPTPTPTQIIVATTAVISYTPTLTLTQTGTSSTSTPTPVPVLSCQRVELFKGGENVTQNLAAIGYGDTVRFVGYANNVGRPVKSLTFRLMIDNTEVERIVSPATLSSNAWVAQYDYTFLTVGAHRVTVVEVTPL